MKSAVERKLQRALALIARKQQREQRRRAALSRFRLRRTYISANRYVKVMVERRLDTGRRLWRMHAQLEGMTETELRELARVTGIVLLDSGRKVRDVAPAAKPAFTSSEPPRA
jgi:hypothetical protein